MRFQATHKLVTYLLVLAAFGTLAATDNLPAPAAVAFLVVWALSWTADPGGPVAAALDRVGTVLRVAMLGVFALAIYEVWHRLPEPDLAPVLYLVLVLLGYKLLFRRGNRDYLHIYVLSFLLVLAASALAGTFLFAAAFAFYVVLGTWTLILFHLRREMEENYLVKHSAQAPSQKVGVGRILNSRRVVGRSFFAATGAVALGVFAGAVTTFALIPRVGAGFVFGSPRPTENLIGFSDDVSLGHYGVLSPDNQTVALRAVLPRLTAMPQAAAREQAVERLYWRGTVYDHYERGHWTRSRDPLLRTVLEEIGRHTFVREPAFEPVSYTPTESMLSAAERQEIEVVGIPVPVVFALDRPTAIELTAGSGTGLRLAPRWSGEVSMRLGPFLHPHSHPRTATGGRPDARFATDPHADGPSDFHGESSGLLAGVVSVVGRHYVAYSGAGPARAGDAESPAIAELPPAVRAAYLALPGSLSPRVGQLVATLTAGKASAPARLSALASWLQSEHEYTLRLPRHPAGVDPVEDFLFDRRAGHCEYFASAMVLLLRAAGVPARYVNGYLGGEWNDIGKYVTVRDNRAHSWVEAYLGGPGWVRVDATPSASGRTSAGRWRQLYESADFYWTRWVVGYDLDRQLDLARRIGRRLGLGGDDGASSGSKVPGWALVVLAVGVLAAAASRRWTRLVPAAPKPPRAATPAGDPPVHKLYRRAVTRLGRSGLPRRQAETPREFAARVTRAQARGSDVFEQLTELYTAARFGRRTIDGDVLRDVGRRLSGLGGPPPAPPG